MHGPQKHLISLPIVIYRVYVFMGALTIYPFVVLISLSCAIKISQATPLAKAWLGKSFQANNEMPNPSLKTIFSPKYAVV